MFDLGFSQPFGTGKKGEAKPTAILFLELAKPCPFKGRRPKSSWANGLQFERAIFVDAEGRGTSCVQIGIIGEAKQALVGRGKMAVGGAIRVGA